MMFIKDMNDEKLIEFVRRNAVIYDISHPKHLDANCKEKVWKEIGEEMHADAIWCKTRWNNIRDNYRKSLRKRISKTALGQKLVKKYKYEDKLGFLYDYFLEKETKTNIFFDESTNEAHEQEYQTIESMDEIIDVPIQIESPVQLNTSKTNVITSSTSTTKTRSENPEYEKIETKSKTKVVTELDPVDIFLNAIAPTLKSFNSYYLNLAKSKIFATVQEYELEMIMDQQKQSQECRNNFTIEQHSFYSESPTPSGTSQHDYLVQSKQCINKQSNE